MSVNIKFLEPGTGTVSEIPGKLEDSGQKIWHSIIPKLTELATEIKVIVS